MKRAVRNVTLGVWVIAATLVATRLWLTHPDSAPRLPEAFWIWLVGVLGSQDGEDLANLELLVVLIISFAVVVAVTMLVLALWQKSRERR